MLMCYRSSCWCSACRRTRRGDIAWAAQVGCAAPPPPCRTRPAQRKTARTLWSPRRAGILVRRGACLPRLPDPFTACPTPAASPLPFSLTLAPTVSTLVRTQLIVPLCILTYPPLFTLPRYSFLT